MEKLVWGLGGSSSDFDFACGWGHGSNGEKVQGFMEDFYQELKGRPHHGKTDTRYHLAMQLGMREEPWPRWEGPSGRIGVASFSIMSLLLA